MWCFFSAMQLIGSFSTIIPLTNRCAHTVIHRHFSLENYGLFLCNHILNESSDLVPFPHSRGMLKRMLWKMLLIKCFLSNLTIASVLTEMKFSSMSNVTRSDYIQRRQCIFRGFYEDGKNGRFYEYERSNLLKLYLRPYRVPPLNPSESIVLWELLRAQ